MNWALLEASTIAEQHRVGAVPALDSCDALWAISGSASWATECSRGFAIVRIAAGKHVLRERPLAAHGFEVRGTKGSVLANEAYALKSAGEVGLVAVGGAKQLDLEKTDRCDTSVRNLGAVMTIRSNPAASGRDGLTSLQSADAARSVGLTGHCLTVSDRGTP